jgi:flagellum-specific ATP synthase
MSPLLRLRAATVGCAVAEYFRDEGADVMLLMDSLTRLAHAQRQIGLAAGEPPTTKGYPPSVFAMLPRIVERAGAMEGGGSITGLFTVLVEGDDLTEPIADAARGVLDGHLTLARRLAERGHFPPIDVLASVSRVADEVSPDALRAARAVVRRALAARGEVEELVQIGAYASGADPWADAALALTDELDGFLRQTRDEADTFDDTAARLAGLAGALRARVEATKRGAA